MGEKEVEIDNLRMVRQKERRSTVNTYLIPAFVANKHYERAVVLLDIVVD